MLHAGNTNKNGFKALIAAEYSGVEVELVKDFQMGVSNKTPEFLKMNPIGKVGYFALDKICYFDVRLCEACVKILVYTMCRFLYWRHQMVLSLRVMPLHDTVRLVFNFFIVCSDLSI